MPGSLGGGYRSQQRLDIKSHSHPDIQPRPVRGRRSGQELNTVIDAAATDWPTNGGDGRRFELCAQWRMDERAWSCA